MRRPADHGHASWICRCLTRRTEAIQPLLPILLSLFLGVDLVELIRRDFPVPTQPKVRFSRPSGVSKTYARFEVSRTQLRQLWHRRELSLADLARRLDVSDLTVRRWAAALGLPYPRPGPKIIFAPVERPHRPDTRQQIQTNRATWIRLVACGTKGPSRNLKSRKLYWWLKRYDQQWLQRHMPKSCCTVSINWSERDRSLSSRVRLAAAAILGRVPLVRASKTRLAHELGRASWLLRHTGRFPKTIAKLRQFEETCSAFAKRCSVGKTSNRQ